MQLLRAAMRALYPTCRCLACGEPRRITPGEPLCDACLAELALHAIPDTACPHCLSPRGRDGACAYYLEIVATEQAGGLTGGRVSVCAAGGEEMFSLDVAARGDGHDN